MQVLQVHVDPRVARIEVTVTRQVREAWEREIERIADVIGEAANVSRKQSSAMAELSGVIQNVQAVSVEAAVRAQDASRWAGSAPTASGCMCCLI